MGKLNTTGDKIIIPGNPNFILNLAINRFLFVNTFSPVIFFLHKISCLNFNRTE